MRQFMSDLRWAMNMIRARRYRRNVGFGERARFDNALRPRLQGERDIVIAYPDAFYHTKIEDLCRAIVESAK